MLIQNVYQSSTNIKIEGGNALIFDKRYIFRVS